MPRHAATLVADAVIIGAGIAGLWLARTLALYGFSVVIVERENEAGSRSTTRNEGWLHRGTYFAASIEDTPTALRVTEQVGYGYQAIMSLYPEVIDQVPPSYAFTQSSDRAGRATRRWREAGVPFKRVPARVLLDLEPRLSLPRDAAVFRVRDASIDTSSLCARLLHDAVSHGARLELGARVESLADGAVLLQLESGRLQVQSTWVIHATGYGMRELLKSVAGIDLPIRLWRSHLIDLPRLFKRNVFSLDPGGINAFHHGEWSIVGLNTETGRRALERPAFEVDATVVEKIMSHVRSMVRQVELPVCQPRTCIKVDRFRDQALPQLDADWGFIGPNQLWVLPGKLTAAPYVASEISKAIFHAGARESRVAERPIDRMDACVAPARLA